jgi:hypothetical protein
MHRNSAHLDPNSPRVLDVTLDPFHLRRARRVRGSGRERRRFFRDGLREGRVRGR